MAHAVFTTLVMLTLDPRLVYYSFVLRNGHRIGHLHHCVLFIPACTVQHVRNLLHHCLSCCLESHLWHMVGIVHAHRFPCSRPTIFKVWVQNVRWQNWTPSKKSVFQSKHLEESCFGRTGQIIRQRPRHSGQRPRQFNFPMHMLKVITRNLRKNVPEFSEFMDEDTNQMHKSTQANRVIARLMIKHDLSQLQANKWFTKKSDRGSLCISEIASSLINISLPCSPQATQRLPSISLKSSCNTAKY